MRVQDIGEQGVLRSLFPYCAAALIGDDAALLPVDGSQALVVTTDSLVDGVHFSVGLAMPTQITMDYQDAGWRSVAANLSDLAAMGATPLGITVGLGLPGEMAIAALEDLYQGMVDCLSQFKFLSASIPNGIPIAGGDVCRSPVLSINITAFGQVAPEQAIRRSQAQPGDVIFVTGIHGAARAGLELLLQPELSTNLDEIERRSLHRVHQRPVPRLDVIQQLPPGRIAGMDSSDGLADAVLQICRASRVGGEIFGDRVLLSKSVCDWLGSPQALEWALYGGEDFELVLCLPEAEALRLLERVEGAIVGRIVVGEGVVLQPRAGEAGEALKLERGFQHFG
jgi:thiamine-monophosphate kinase